jgi:hypothetical protein
MYLSEKHASNQNTSSGADPGGRTEKQFEWEVAFNSFNQSIFQCKFQYNF